MKNITASEQMSECRRLEIERYLSGFVQSTDEPWTLPDMLWETLNEIQRLKEANENSFKLLTMATKERDVLRTALTKLHREASGVLREYNSHGDICATNRGVLLDRIRLAKDVLRSSGSGQEAE